MVRVLRSPDTVARPATVYSHVLAVDGVAYLAGQSPRLIDGSTVDSADPAGQVRQAFTNMGEVLKSVDTDFGAILRLAIFLRRMEHVALFWQVARAYLGGHRPSVTLTAVDGLAGKDYLLEMDTIALQPMSAAQATEQAMRFINPREVHDPIMPYSHALVAGNTIYISAQLPLDRDGNLVGPGDPGAQTEQVFKNLQAVLRGAGADLKDVVKLTTYMTSLSYRPVVIEVRKRYFGDHHAPSILAIVPELPVPGALIEVDGIAVVEGHSQVE